MHVVAMQVYNEFEDTPVQTMYYLLYTLYISFVDWYQIQKIWLI